jgi:hypothetical protein
LDEQEFHALIVKNMIKNTETYLVKRSCATSSVPSFLTYKIRTIIVPTTISCMFSESDTGTELRVKEIYWFIVKIWEREKNWREIVSDHKADHTKFQPTQWGRFGTKSSNYRSSYIGQKQPELSILHSHAQSTGWGCPGKVP